MHIAPASTPISHDMHLAVVAERDALRLRLTTLEAAFEKLQFDLQTLLRQRFGVRSESIDQLHRIRPTAPTDAPQAPVC